MSKGPTKGGRWLVKLPFGNTTAAKNNKAGKSQLVKIKQGVAKFLGWEAVKTLPTQTVNMKTASGSVQIKRIPNVGARGGRSIIVLLAKNTNIGKKQVKQFSVPLGTGCTNNDAIKYFQKQDGKGIIGVVTTEGRRVIWGEQK